jgi:iron complex outermembrane receptor protein
VQATERLFLDVAGFYNEYDHLRTLEPGMPNLAVLPPVFPLIGDNKMKGETYGVECTADWNALDWWRLTAGYTYLEMELHLYDDSMDPTNSESGAGESPENQFFLRSHIDLPKNFEFDPTLRYVDSLPSFDVDNYVTLDVRLGWKATKSLEFSIAGRNLLDNQHLEYRSTAFIDTEATEIPRSVYGKVTWRF